MKIIKWQYVDAYRGRQRAGNEIQEWKKLNEFNNFK